jgi:hypothetical protein
MKVIERTWWRLLSVPDEGYSSNVPDEGYWAYLMKVIERTWWRLLSVPDEGYWAYLMKVIERTWWRLLSVTWWRLFQKRVVRTKFDIYVFIKTIYTFHQLVFQTAALNLSTGLLITMDSGSRFQTDIVRGKNDSCLCWVLQRGIMKDEEDMSRDCLWVNE